MPLFRVFSLGDIMSTELKSLDEISYNPIQEKMLNILRTKTQNIESNLYFRVVSAFYLAQMASNMRVSINTPHRGEIPINMFTCALMESGGGKGHSLNVLERDLLKGFKGLFMKHTFPSVAEANIIDTASTKALLNNTDQTEELEALTKEYLSLGHMPYSFDSGTGPAYKQVRTKAQIAQIGALSMICDEIGTNLLGNAELFSVNLEAYDIGLIKQKIIKNSADNKRGEERDDPVPSNMLIFGTPSKLFNGAAEEKEFYSLLETGYARRLLYGIGTKSVSPNITAEELFDTLTSASNDQDVDDLCDYFTNLADEINYSKLIDLNRDVALINIQYQIDCEREAATFPEHETIRKAEMQHRYFKALKLAGAYAFVEGCHEISEDHMYAAIKLVEDSGMAFKEILARDKPYVRLAKYVSQSPGELTHADLTEDLPFYRGSKSNKDDMMALAMAWGHKNNIIIKKSYVDNIEFFIGETLKETNLDNILISYSTHPAYQYRLDSAPFHGIEKLTQMDGYHFCNHGFLDGHRKEDNVIPEFNMIILDVDGGCSLETAKLLLKDYECLFYTTKRSTDEVNRFRILIPIKYHLKLQSTEFKEFMANVFRWLPFKTDEETAQRSKKWLSNNGHFERNFGELLDPVMFIPKTSRNQEYEKDNANISDVDRTEAWFAKSMVDGRRNNTMLKYALMLLDSGLDASEVEKRILKFNGKLVNSLPVNELKETVLKTVWGRANATKT